MTDEIITQLGYLNEEKQKITLEIGKLKNNCCYEIFPTLEEIARAFNLDSEFIKYYKDIKSKKLKLRDLVDKERNRIVKFYWKIVSFYSVARLDIDLKQD